MLYAVTSFVATAAAAYAGYATMSPRSQLYGRTITHGSDPGQTALTYDDGPNDPYTLRLLDVLARHNARATFFLIGRYVRQRPDIARAIQAAGHAIGNHTDTHPNLIFLSPGRLRQELDGCRKALEDTIGSPAPLFRPPFGGRRPAVLKAARALGLTTVMWSVTGFDWSAKSSEPIFRKVTEQIDDPKPRGEIVLLHDGGHLAFGTDRGFTVQATDAILKRCSSKKKFVTVPELTQS